MVAIRVIEVGGPEIASYVARLLGEMHFAPSQFAAILAYTGNGFDSVFVGRPWTFISRALMSTARLAGWSGITTLFRNHFLKFVWSLFLIHSAHQASLFYDFFLRITQALIGPS
jgi:hypothetical protein